MSKSPVPTPHINMYWVLATVLAYGDDKSLAPLIKEYY